VRFRTNADLQAAWRAGIRTKFRCPACGGSAFGSRGVPPNLERCCHGDDAGDGRHGCRFSWHERDDYKYFHVPA